MENTDTLASSWANIGHHPGLAPHVSVCLLLQAHIYLVQRFLQMILGEKKIKVFTHSGSTEGPGNAENADVESRVKIESVITLVEFGACSRKQWRPNQVASMTTVVD